MRRQVLSTRIIQWPPYLRCELRYTREAESTNVDAVAELPRPYEASQPLAGDSLPRQVILPRQMRSYPVSSRVNHIVNDDEECARPIEIVEEQPGLFVK
jgi:hypothetical protein